MRESGPRREFINTRSGHHTVRATEGKSDPADLLKRSENGLIECAPQAGGRAGERYGDNVKAPPSDACHYGEHGPLNFLFKFE